ncbi:GGDEF domain-containing protein [Pelagibacterium limicola]|uniref:GGDEF domain-containing protein n=1 Tax=Pelagibacterium limicola TaxID=2791022 RepID=UPI0018AF5E6D|nr:GGDEF domain-containing protein [Pelagibacterium limicola]
MDYAKGVQDRTAAILDDLIRDPAIMAETERQLSGRTRHIRLEGAMAAGYRARMWRQHAKVIRSWMSWVIIINALTLVLNMVLLPDTIANAMLAPGAVIFPAALGVILVWLRRRQPIVEDATLLGGLFVILLAVSWMAVAAGPVLLERYLNIMLFVGIAAIIIFDVPFRQTLAIAVYLLALYLIFHFGAGGADSRTILSGFMFFASGVAATVMARRTMSILARKSFLLELRDRRRMIDLSETNVSLEQLSRVDGLTGLSNRHRMHECMAALWRTGSDIGLLMCDVDDFKALNDSLGHLAGDRCLVEVAQLIKKSTRQADCVARYGGEEFVVVLSASSSAHASTIAERIRKSVEEAGLPHPASRVAPVVTLSIGIAIWKGTKEQLSPEQLLGRADAALYRAKQSGRNRVEEWTPALDPAEA